MIVFLLLIYLALCLVVALLGRDRRAGYAGTLAIAVVFTPFLAYIGLVLFEPSAVD